MAAAGTVPKNDSACSGLPLGRGREGCRGSAGTNAWYFFFFFFLPRILGPKSSIMGSERPAAAFEDFKKLVLIARALRPISNSRGENDGENVPSTRPRGVGEDDAGLETCGMLATAGCASDPG